MKTLSDKRGLALENAIIFMMIVFSLCTLLTTFVLIGTRRTQMAEKAFFERIAVEEIVEIFLEDPTAYTAQKQEYSGYRYAITEQDADRALLTVWKKTEEADVIRLYALAELDGTTWQITYRDKRPPA